MINKYVRAVITFPAVLVKSILGEDWTFKASLIIFIMVFVVLYKDRIWFPFTVKPGQMYVWEYRDPNPFNSTNNFNDTLIVLDIKKGFVLYNRSMFSSMSTESKFHFDFLFSPGEYHLIKDLKYNTPKL